MTHEQNREIREAVVALDEVRTRLLFFDYDLNGDDRLSLTDGISSIEDAMDLLSLLIDE